jgi:predicted GIY-YIG superfamily endonuclease
MPAKLKKQNVSRTVWLLYILKCSDGSLYTGITNNMSRRLKQHNDGTASRYTRSRLPVRIAFQERCPNRSAALKKEYSIKQLSKKRKKEYIIRKSKTPH